MYACISCVVTQKQLLTTMTTLSFTTRQMKYGYFGILFYQALNFLPMNIHSGLFK